MDPMQHDDTESLLHGKYAIRRGRLLRQQMITVLTLLLEVLDLIVHATMARRGGRCRYPAEMR